MKNFKLMGLDFECEDKYNYATVDEDGSFWVYVDDPYTTDIDWDAEGDMLQIHPFTYDGNSTHWKDSKIEI